MIQLDLQPELEAHLAAAAQSRGVPLPQYVESLLAAAFNEEEELQEAFDDVAAGRTRPAREFFKELHKQYGIRG